MRLALLLFLSAFSFQLSAFAADSFPAQRTTTEASSSSVHSAWLTVALGLSQENRGAALVSATCTSPRGLSLTLRRAESLDITGHGTLVDYALLLGKRFNPFANMVVITALGPAWTRDHRNDLERINYKWKEVDHVRETGGLVGQVEVVLPVIVRVAALGVTAFGNVNPRRSYAALALSLHLGYIR